MPIITRFAPSPTGELHIGHVFAAKVAHDLAKSSADGSFLLRIEDIDHSRSKPQYEGQIQTDLEWLGLPWDGEILRQSERIDHYESALEDLKNRSLAYPCFCTRKEIQAELAAAAAAPHECSELPYPGTCRKLSTSERRHRISAGHSHCWRLDSISTAPLCEDLGFTDLLHGTLPVDPSLIGDVVLARKDIGVAYHLAVVVDDAYQQITHVTRGEDLLPATPIHRILQHLLDLPAPTYLHHALVVDDTGKRLAKRHDSLSIRHLRDQGFTPTEIMAMIPHTPDWMT